MGTDEGNLRLDEVLRKPEPAAAALWLGRFSHLSSSSLTMLHRCPEQFRRRYILGERRQPNEAGVIGSVFHETMTWNFAQKIRTHDDRPLPEIVEYLHDKAWPDTLTREGGPDEVFWDSPNLDEPRRTAERITTAYRRQVTERVQPTAVEQRHEKALPGVLPVPLVGYLDTETDFTIIDTKTGRQAVKKPKPEWVLQSGIYQIFRPKPVHIHTISRAKSPSIWTPLDEPRLLLTYIPEREQETKRTLRDLAAHIEHYMNRYGPDDPWPTLGTLHDWACNYCGWRKVCPAWAWERPL